MSFNELSESMIGKRVLLSDFEGDLRYEATILEVSIKSNSIKVKYFDDKFNSINKGKTTWEPIGGFRMKKIVDFL